MADDVWVGLDLTDIFPGTQVSLDLQQEALLKAKDEADKIILSFEEKAAAATESLRLTSSLLEQIQQTGYDVLMLNPADGDFFERVANSNNQPFPNDYTAGICIFFGSPSLSETAKKYKALTDIITG